jgi:hypothetical protein
LTDLRREVVIILVFLLFICKNLFAQNPYIQRYTTSDGLPSNTVYTVFQDSKKFLWFATDAGVARYDGTKFIYFRKQDGLSSNDVFDIKEDSYGRIWFFQINASFNFYSDNFIHNEKNTPYLDSLKGSYFCKKMYEDSARNIYFYDNPQGIIYSLSSSNIVTRYKLPSLMVKNDLMPGMYDAMAIHHMERNSEGEFTFLTIAGVVKSKALNAIPKIESAQYHYKDILTSSDKALYALFRENGKNEYVIKKFTDEGTLKSRKALPDTGSALTFSILEDKNGFLWISTYDKGVFCYKGDSLIYHLKIKNAHTIFQDHENNIWICSLLEGVYQINPYIILHKHLESTVFQNNGISKLCRKDSTGIWFTDGMMIYALVNNKLCKLDFQNSENSFNELLQVGHNKLIIGETSKNPFSLEGVTINLPAKKIRCEKVSRSQLPMKKIIYNPEKNEISSYNQFSIYFMNPDELFRKITTERIDERIYNTYYDSGNNLILNAKNPYLHKDGISTITAELKFLKDKLITEHLNLGDSAELFNIDGDSLYILNNNRIINLSEKLKQPFHLIIKNLYYQDSILYIASPKKIYTCKNPLNVLQDKSVQLQMMNINFPTINDILVNNNMLYVASDDGLTSIPVADIQRDNISPPIPYILSIKVNDIEKDIRNNQVNFMGSKRVNIAFTGINYSISPITYSYKLEGADSSWTISAGNDVVIQNLPNGKYKFKLRTKRLTSAWSEPVEVGIVVKATLWEHPLFYFVVLLLAIGIIFLLILRQKNSQLRRQEVAHQMILLEQKSLQAMMNPHFIFNSLGSIQNYMLNNKPYEAGIYLSQFARLIRQNLNAIDTSMINLEEEVNRVKNYLDLEKLRLGDKFDYVITIHESIESEEILIPSMIIQPFVENAIWHGIANLEEKGYVYITFQLHSHKSLRIIVEDSGIGIENSEKYNIRRESHLNLGMTIIRKRLKLLSKKYGTDTGITLSEYAPGSVNPGTKVIIITPFIKGKSALPS